jgi:hypothetical protein
MRGAGLAITRTGIQNPGFMDPMFRSCTEMGFLEPRLSVDGRRRAELYLLPMVYHRILRTKVDLLAVGVSIISIILTMKNP